MMRSLFRFEFNNYNILLYRLCPIFQVSNVNGENLDLLKMFLNLLTTRVMSTDNEPAEFQIDDTYSVPVCVYCVLSKRILIILVYIFFFFNFRVLEQ